MTTPLRLLILQEKQDETELLLAKLRKAGYAPDYHRTDNRTGLREALQHDDWQIIIADYCMPAMNALDALKIIREKNTETPVILISASAGEDRAVEAMRTGANDYIVKDSLTRLIPAIERELRKSRDREDRQRTEEALYQERERALITLHSIGDGVITTDADGRVDYMNPVAERVTGWTYAEAQGYPLLEVLPLIDESTRRSAENPAELSLNSGRIVSLGENYILINRNGQEFHIEDSTAPIFDRKRKVIGAVLVFHDVTRERRMAGQMAWQASHDNLTGLPNRVEFSDRLNNLLENMDAHDRQHALLYLDLDQFKVINDICGHTAGDEMLKQLSQLLRSHLAATVSLARLGGDEFGILLENVSLTRARDFAEQILQTIGTFTFSWDVRRFDVTTSIGMMPIHKGTPNASFVLSAADLACYVAKEAGRNRVHVYEESDIEQGQRHSEMHWVSRIKEAVDDNRLLLYRQTITPLQDNNKTPHYELLIRMQDVDGKLVEPDSFIPAAERFNLMNALDRWTIDTAFRHIRDARFVEQAGIYSINLSGNSLNDNQLPAYIQQKLSQYQVDASCLCFEITETAAVFNLANASSMIHSLKVLGCKFSLDDFGSGLSSFGYLKNLPVDFLKIDGGFVKDMISDPMNHTIVEAIHQVGHTLGIRTIAEFVENQDIADRLRDIGVDFAQGYHFSKPVPLSDAANVVPLNTGYQQ